MQNVQHSMQNQILDIDSVFFYLKKKSSLQRFSMNKMGGGSHFYTYLTITFSLV